jgi:diguanylate cyclase (GGDEF)-like protein
VADRLRHAVRAVDQVGRLGGDEFLVICPDVESEARALEIASRIARALFTTVEIDGCRADVRASVGVAWTDEQVDADALIARADAAMYTSKRAGVGAAALHAGGGS